MLKKLKTRTGIIAVATAVLLLGALSAGTVLASSPDTNSSGQAAVQDVEDDDAAEAEAEMEEVDNDDVEEQVGDQSELDDDADEAAAEDPVGGLESQVEQDGEFEGEF